MARQDDERFASVSGVVREDTEGGRGRVSGQSRNDDDTIATLVEELAAEFQDVASREDVEQELRAHYELLARESKVPEFVPVLALRAARAGLSQRLGR